MWALQVIEGVTRLEKGAWDLVVIAVLGNRANSLITKRIKFMDRRLRRFARELDKIEGVSIPVSR